MLHRLLLKLISVLAKKDLSGWLCSYLRGNNNAMVIRPYIVLTNLHVKNPQNFPLCNKGVFLYLTMTLKLGFEITTIMPQVIITGLILII